jgi:hypothetical protein
MLEAIELKQQQQQKLVSIEAGIIWDKVAFYPTNSSGYSRACKRRAALLKGPTLHQWCSRVTNDREINVQSTNASRPKSTKHYVQLQLVVELSDSVEDSKAKSNGPESVPCG